MLIRLIAPEYRSYAGIKDAETVSQRKLSLIYLAALTPKDFDVEVIDCDIHELKYDNDPDLVGISFNSVTMNKAYEIADKYKSMGIPVVFGGFHASIFPEEALQHGDAVIVGEAEIQWEKLLIDFKNGAMQKIYKNDGPIELKNLPIPRYDLFKRNEYYKQMPLFITRGCPYKCSFCCIRSVYGPSYRKRPVSEVIEQIKYIKENYDDNTPVPLFFSFVDDNIWGDKKYARELFTKLEPLNINWYVQGASLNLDEDLLKLASQSGCNLVFIGFESLNDKNLEYLNKGQNKVEKYKEFIDKLHNANISIGAYFITGLPYDEPDLFDKLESFMEENYIEIPMLMIYNLIPGTESYQKSGYEHMDYNYMINNLPLYTPKGMSKKDFREKFVAFHRSVFSDESIDKRLKKSRSIAVKFFNKGRQDFYKNSKWDEWVVKSEKLN